MSKIFKRPSVCIPTAKEDKTITVAARSDSNAQPLTSKQLKAMVPMRLLRGWPKSQNKKLLVSVRYGPEAVEYFKSTGDGGCAINLWVMRSPPLEKGAKGGFLIENCLLLQKSPLTPLCQRGVIRSLPTNLSHTR
jgi:uncharacterized protein (DUF4415 family)